MGPGFPFLEKIQIFNSPHSYTKNKGLFSALMSSVKQYLVFLSIENIVTIYFIFFIIYKSRVTIFDIQTV